MLELRIMVILIENTYNELISHSKFTVTQYGNITKNCVYKVVLWPYS